MKTAKIVATLSVMAALPFTAVAQVSPYVSAQVDEMANSCTKLAAASEGLPEEAAKAVANAALQPCYDALSGLQAFLKENSEGMTAEELNYFYYVAGNVMWITAGSETMKNDGQLSPRICTQVDVAERLWGNVNVPAESSIDLEMKNSSLRAMLFTACQEARSSN